MFAERKCNRCQCDTPQEVCKKVTANNMEFYGWWCLQCKWWSEGTWILKAKLLADGIDLSVLYTAQITDSQRCVKCGQRGAELHHWAPVHLFGRTEADIWPKDFLCTKCHLEWHNKVTPEMSKV